MERLTHRRARTLLESFNFAVEGIIHVLRTQRNMRFHFLAAVAVLIAAIAIGVSKLELIALLLAIAFVFITEMINSALEQAIDVATTSFDPLAKLAKDVAAGAVLIATVNAVAIGYLVFAGEVSERSTNLLDRLADGVPRRADADRGRRPLDARGRVRRPARGARHARDLPTLLMSGE